MESTDVVVVGAGPTGLACGIELKRRGVTIVSEPVDVPNISRRFAFFADPWGNLFELTQRISA